MNEEPVVSGLRGQTDGGPVQARRSFLAWPVLGARGWDVSFLIGVPVTLLMIGVIYVLSRYTIVPEPASLLMLGIAYAGYTRGRRAGLLSAGLCFAFMAWHTSVPGQPFNWTLNDALKLTTLSVAMPVMGVLVGMLRRDHDRIGAQLRGRERRLSVAAINALSAQLAVLDGSGTIVMVNDAWRRFADANGLGDPDYAVGKSYLGAFERPGADPLNADQLTIVSGIRSVLNGTRDTYRADYPCDVPGGRAWFQMRVNRLTDPVIGDLLGQPRTSVHRTDTYLVIAHEDVTEITSAREALRAGEERYRLLFEQSPQMMWVVHRQSLAILNVNEAALRQLGYERKRFLKLTVMDLRPSSDVPEMVRLHQQSLSSGGWIGPARYVCGDGSIIEADTVARDIDYMGIPARLVLATDVTERNRVQHERDTALVELSRAKEQAEQERAVAQRERELAQHERTTAESERMTAEHARAVAEDARVLAETAGRAKDRFLAMLSHELRTPLTPVLATVSELVTDPCVSPAQRATFEMIRRNIKLEARLIDDLLDVSRISAGKLRLSPQFTDLHTLIQQTVEICAGDVEQARLTLHVELQAVRSHVLADPARLQQAVWNLLKNAVKFTPAGGTLTLRTWNPAPVDLSTDVTLNTTGILSGSTGNPSQSTGNPSQSTGNPSQSTGNPSQATGLISQTTEIASQTKRLTSQATGLTSEVCLSVSDTGIGIDPALLGRIFDPFEQGNSPEVRATGGLGLGLAISKAVVEASGGSLVAHSAGRGRGSTFTVSLAPCDPPQLTVRERPTSPPVPAPVSRDGGLRILLVEDHHDTLGTMTRLLRKFGHTVTPAPGFADAIRFFDEHRGQFDLIISDIGLGDGDGRDLPRLLGQIAERYDAPPVRAIALTGFAGDDDARSTHNAGFVEHLAKPLDFALLEATIRRVTTTREQ